MSQLFITVPAILHYNANSFYVLSSQRTIPYKNVDHDVGDILLPVHTKNTVGFIVVLCSGKTLASRCFSIT